MKSHALWNPLDQILFHCMLNFVCKSFISTPKYLSCKIRCLIWETWCMSSSSDKRFPFNSTFAFFRGNLVKICVCAFVRLCIATVAGTKQTNIGSNCSSSFLNIGSNYSSNTHTPSRPTCTLFVSMSTQHSSSSKVK